MKICFKCNKEQPLTNFYAHKAMRAGILNKCKDCTKNDCKLSNGNLSRKCLECGKEFRTRITEVKRGGGLVCSRSCYYERFKKIVKRGGESPKWINGTVSYAAYHDRVRAKRGKPRVCSICDTTEAKKFEWASITGNYSDIYDYIRLCSSCHRKFDAFKRKLSKP